MTAISTKNLNISYGNLDIVKDLNLEIPKGKITTIIGANGCGKSTILKTIARILTPKSGDIFINGTNIKEQSSKDLAKTMAVLPQSPQAPKGLTVEELIAYGRFPHQKGFGRLKDEDEDIVTWALEVTGIKEFRDRPIEALSGGQRQRAWIVMVIHELNNASRFAHHMIGIKKGKIACEGSAHEVMTKENLKELFNIDAEIVEDPRSKKPVCITYDMVG